MITVVGIGLKKGDLTENGQAAIKKAKKVFSRNKTYFDTIEICKDFKDVSNFEDLDKAIVEYLIAAEKEYGDIAFAVYGDGFSDTAAELLQETTAINIVPGLAEYRGRKSGTAINFVSAYDISERSFFDTSTDLMIYQIDNKLIAGDIKLRLTEFYADDFIVTFSSGTKSLDIPLYDIDRQGSYQNASIFIVGETDFTKKRRYDFADLYRIMKRLTDPDGCPWDKAQTHESIRKNLLEEAYELCEALITDDTENIIEELGDVLLQVVFHTDMAERSGEYSLGDVISMLCEKLVFRHTHIFGEVKANNADEALVAWENAKSVEKNYDSLAGQLDRLPKTFPASLLSQKVYKKTVKAGAKADKEKIRAAIIKILQSENSDTDSVKKLLLLSAFYAAEYDVDFETALLDETNALTKSAKSAEEKNKLKGLFDNL